MQEGNRFSVNVGYKVCTFNTEHPILVSGSSIQWQGMARFQYVGAVWGGAWEMEVAVFTDVETGAPMPTELQTQLTDSLIQQIPGLYSESIRHKLGTEEQERIQVQMDARKREILALKNELAYLENDYWQASTFIHALPKTVKIDK